MLNEIIASIRSAEHTGEAGQANKEILTGFSGKKLLGLLQRVNSLFEHDDQACYLEVGIFQGLTLLSVASHCRSLSCFGIDDFSYTAHGNNNYDIVKERIANLGLSNVTVINKDYEDAFEVLESNIASKKIAVYFIDGPHDYRSQLMCLEYAVPYLHDNALIVVDDSNYQHVRQANRDFLVTHKEWKLVFEAYTQKHPHNMTDTEYLSASDGWWNGVNVLARDLDNVLNPMLPPTDRARTLYINQHVVHSNRFAELAPDSVAFVAALFGPNILRLPGRFIRLLSAYHANRSTYKDRFDSMNTYSAALPEAHYHPFFNAESGT